MHRSRLIKQEDYETLSLRQFVSFLPTGLRCNASPSVILLLIVLLSENSVLLSDLYHFVLNDKEISFVD